MKGLEISKTYPVAAVDTLLERVILKGQHYSAHGDIAKQDVIDDTGHQHNIQGPEF